ncbi:MAG: PD40 domain-containing protein, partial [Acidobacteria bacterium]|nr:PD40 domain-containing protein [Acidobacteriota bacterium]
MKKSQALVLLLTVLPALTGQGMLAQSQLSGYWKFDGNAQDSSGNANHGQQVGAPLYVRSQLGSAIGLNGVTDYVKVASTPSLETWHANRQLTLEAWIYPTRMDRDMFVFGKQGGNCSDELAVWVEPIGGDQGVIGAHVVDDCGTERPRRLYSNPNKPILPNNWYHVALVWDGSAAKHMLYINAVLEDSESLLRDPVNFREELHIGHVRGDPQNLFIFEGLIDETQMWSVARTAAEIKSDMHRERILFYSNRDGNYEVYVMGTDGSNVTRLTNSSANESDASWSPDGRRIVFTSDRHDPR